MDQLIAELEAATEGSRELDRQIYKVVFRDKQSPFEERRLTTDMEYVPSYTNSLDYALALVPEGWRWEAADYGGDQDGPRAALWHGIPAENIDDVQHHGAFGETPALALCIAALRARQAMETA